MNYVNSDCSQTSSHTAEAIALYFDSADDLEIVGCFFDFQDINESPIKTQKLVIDFLVSIQAAQFTSELAFNCRPDSTSF